MSIENITLPNPGDHTNFTNPMYESLSGGAPKSKTVPPAFDVAVPKEIPEMSSTSPKVDPSQSYFECAVSGELNLPPQALDPSEETYKDTIGLVQAGLL